MHSKQWHYSLHRDFQNCYSTRRSLTRFFKLQFQLQFQLQFYMCTLHYTSIQRILHPEIQFYTQKTESSLSTAFQKRNSTHRRQGDLLESIRVSYKTFQALQPQVLTKATPVTPETFQSFQIFQTFQSFQSFQMFQSFQTLQRHSGHSSHS